MPVDAKTIQIFLPDGEPRGIRIVEMGRSSTRRLAEAEQAEVATIGREAGSGDLPKAPKGVRAI